MELSDAYRKWLGIPAREQPPHHYRLLGIAPLEDDPDVIENAADRQMAHVRTFQAGKNAVLSQRILNELAAAKLCLLDRGAKLQYDAQLQTALSAGATEPAEHAPPEEVISSPASVERAPARPSLPRPEGIPLATSVSGVSSVSLSTEGDDETAPVGTVRSGRRAVRSRSRRQDSLMPVVLILGGAGLCLFIGLLVLLSGGGGGSPDYTQNPSPSSGVEPIDEPPVDEDPAELPVRKPVRPKPRPHPGGGRADTTSAELPGGEFFQPQPSDEPPALDIPAEPAAQPEPDESLPEVAADPPASDETVPSGLPDDVAHFDPSAPMNQPPDWDAIAQVVQPAALTFGAMVSAVPDASSLAAARRRMTNIYGREIDRSKTPEEKRQLIALLQQDALKESDDPLCYAILEKACLVAAELPDPALLAETIDAMAVRFRIDPLHEKAVYLGKGAVAAGSQPEALDALALQLDTLREQAVGEGRLEAAAELTQTAARLARQRNQLEPARELEALATDLTERVKARQQAVKAMETLRSGSDDPKANAVLGAYLCFLADRDELGLPFIAKGPPSDLQKAAQHELPPAKEAGDLFELVQQWQALSRRSGGVLAGGILRHAGRLLEARRDQLAGADRAKADQILEDIRGRAGVEPAPAADSFPENE